MLCCYLFLPSTEPMYVKLDRKEANRSLKDGQKIWILNLA